MSTESFNPAAFAELIDLEDGGSPGLIADLIADFLTNSVLLRAAIEASSKAGDFKLLERSAHSLKSSARLLGLDALADVAYRIEEDARNGRVIVDDVQLIGLYLEPAHVDLMRFRDSRPTV